MEEANPQTTQMISPALEEPPSIHSSLPKPNKLPVLLFLFIGIVITGVSGGVGYWLGMQQAQSNDSPMKVAEASPSSSTEPVFCTMEAKICPDGSSVGRTGPNCEFAECPESSEEWERKVYSLNNHVIWDIVQPIGTTANEAGLHEAYLGIQTSYEGIPFMVGFSQPSFTMYDVPTSVDEWVKSFMQYELNDNYVDRSVQVIDGQTRLIKTTSLSPGGMYESSMPMDFILIWKNTELLSDGVPKHAVISVKPDNYPQADKIIMETFVQKLINGINF